MPRPPSPEQLARATARRPLLTIGVWAALLVAAAATVALLLPGTLATDTDVTTETEAKRAERLIEERFPAAATEPRELVIVRSRRYRVDEREFRERVAVLMEELRGLGATVIQGGAVAPGARATLVPFELGEETEIEDVARLADGLAAEPGFDAAVYGPALVDRDFHEISERDLRTAESFGVATALVVLVLVFGSLVAALVPLLLAGISVVVALAGVALLGQVLELSVFVTNMVAGMGLALGIDYSLFVLSRYREERGRGRMREHAITAAGATASRAVLFSGIAVVVALASMVLVPDTVLRSLAAGAVLVATVAVLAALTLLPALLALLGDAINRLGVPVIGRAAASGQAEGRFWTWVATRVMRRPVAALLISAGLLIAAAVPALDLRTGASGVGTLPEHTRSLQGFRLMQDAFRTGSVEPTRVVVAGEVTAAPVRAAIGRLEDALAADPAFSEARLAATSPAGLAIVSARVAGDPWGERAIAAVRRLRHDHVPAAGFPADAEVLVGGPTAGNVDYVEASNGARPRVFGFVLALSFVLLAVAFRSLVVPLKAIVLNLLSVAAAYGLLVLVFQHGVGAGTLGLEQTETIEVWVPLLLFAILFGLSMDYHVFLLSRIRERYRETGDNARAVAFGLGSTGRIVTGAALIIIVVFTGFTLGELAMFQQMGFGVAVALLLDATIVRSLLVPAAMQLLGERNWYLPGALAWLPDLRVEAGDRIDA